MPSFTFTPDFGMKRKRKPNVAKIEFGDGYQQRQTKGINTLSESWDLRFAVRTKDEADDIDDFLIARNGVESFDWTPPGEASSIKVVCFEWDREIVRENQYQITATFERVYEP